MSVKELLVLPDCEPAKIAKEGQRWAFFRSWPPDDYHFDWISAYIFPGWSQWVEGKLLHSFLTQSLLAFWREARYDIVIAHGSRSIVGLAFLHRVLGRRSPKLLVFDIESFGRPHSGVKLWLVRRATEALDGVIYHAAVQKEYYDTYLPWLGGKSHFVPLGVGVPAKKLTWEETGRGDFVLSFDTLATGRREWGVLIEALSRIDRRPPVRIVGKTQWQDGELAGRTCPADVELLPRMSSAALRLWMEQSMLAVLPLTERGHAHGQLSVLTLMAAGAAVVVSDTSGVRDYVRDGETALVYRPGDASDLAQKIQWALEHPEERCALGRRAREVVQREFNDETFSRRIYDLVDGLTDPAGS